MELSPEFIAKEGLKGVTRGIYVAEVQDRTAAKEAGLVKGDVITHINGAEVVSTGSLQEVLARCSPGDRIRITYVRDGKTANVDVTLRNRDGKTSVTTPETAMGILGATFEKASDELLEKLEISRGVQVSITDNSGRFHEAGISDGFIITSVNNMKVSKPEDIEKIFDAIRALPAGEEKVMFISGYYPTGKAKYYAVDLN